MLFRFVLDLFFESINSPLMGAFYGYFAFLVVLGLFMQMCRVMR